MGDPVTARSLLRRAVTIPALFLALLLVVVSSPVLALLAGGFDLLRADRGWPTVRLVGFLLLYLLYEAGGVLRSLWIWLTQPLARRDWAERNHRLQMWWTRSLMRAARPVLGLRVEVEAHGSLRPGPVIVASRHVSIVDALLPAHVLGVGEDLRLRYVLTEGLRYDPCLDIAGHRLPNHFVDRKGETAEMATASLEGLATGMGPEDAVVIFPEGGLFTDARRDRSLAYLERTSSDRLETARHLHHLLLPRPSGTLALLRAAEDADVVLVAHHGFEPLASLKRLWRTLPLTEPVRLRIERFDRSGVPASDEDRIAWLDERWLEMDAWLGETIAARSAGAPEPA